MELDYGNGIKTGCQVLTVKERAKIEKYNLKQKQLKKLLALKAKMETVRKSYDNVITTVWTETSIKKFDDVLRVKICQEVQELRERHMLEIKSVIQESDVLD